MQFYSARAASLETQDDQMPILSKKTVTVIVCRGHFYAIGKKMHWRKRHLGIFHWNLS